MWEMAVWPPLAARYAIIYPSDRGRKRLLPGGGVGLLKPFQPDIFQGNSKGGILTNQMKAVQANMMIIV